MGLGRLEGTQSWTLVGSSLKILFIFIEKEGREKERERDINVWEKHQSVAPHTPPTGGLACNPGTSPDWESNRRPFGSLNPLSHTSQGGKQQFKHPPVGEPFVPTSVDKHHFGNSPVTCNKTQQLGRPGCRVTSIHWVSIQCDLIPLSNFCGKA